MTAKDNKYRLNSNLRVDFSKYKTLKKVNRTTNFTSVLNQDDYTILKQVGMDLNRHAETGGFLLYDNNVFTTHPQIEGLEILPLSDAIELYPWIKEKYYFSAIDKNMDEFTQQVSSEDTPGYFIRVKKM